VRSESRFFSEGNSNEIVGYAAINEGNGYDVNTNSTAGFPPLLNTRQNRKNQLRARARIGLAVDISDATKAGVRLASGSDDSPVSTTQTLGGVLARRMCGGPGVAVAQAL
jgi:hypothetical protein